MTATTDRPVEILLVEDNPGDVDLMRESLAEVELSHNLSVIEEGEEALAFLRRESQYVDAARPDIIVLDLNLPRKHGRQVLAEIKADDHLKRIPVLVLTTSRAQEDVRTCYDLHANCYITKPRQFDEYHQVMQRIKEFWFTTVTLPLEEQP